MVCFDLEPCLSISLLTEQAFEKASFQPSPKPHFSGLKEKDNHGLPPPPAPKAGIIAREGLCFALYRAGLERNAAIWMLSDVTDNENPCHCPVRLHSDLALLRALIL